MPRFDQLDERRGKYAETAHDSLSPLIRAAQGVLYRLLADWIAEFTTDGGKLVFGVRNFGRVGSIGRLFDKFGPLFRGKLLKPILDRSDNVLDLNRQYFEAVAPGKVTESVIDLARNQTLLRWGYNPATGELLAGSYFENIFGTNEVARKAASMVNQAIAQKMPLAEFQKTFKGLFVGAPGNGMLERHFNTNSFDLFQRVDRSANLIYADKLGMNYAIYSGTVMDNTRPFCRARVNKVFNREEIKGWAKLSFQGKSSPYDPFTDCGGYRCRHHLSFVSDEIAKALEDRRWKG
jgi:hypothetical protein